MEPSGARTPPAGSTPRTRGRTCGERVWDLFEEPASSLWAFALSILLMTAITMSTVCFIISSMPRYEKWPGWEPLEILFVSIFTVEYVLRFASCPMSKCKFVWEPFNLIDLVSILPFYIEVIVHLIYTGDAHTPDLRVLRTIRLFRIARVFKLGKYATVLQVLAQTMIGSSEAIFMLLFCLFVALTFFGAAMYYTERGEWVEAQGCYVRTWAEQGCSPFSSIPLACYWGVTTITTVGYGDVLPTTPTGRFISALTMICGILVIALPVTLIGQAFVLAFKEQKNTMEASKAMQLEPHEFRVFSERCRHSAEDLGASVLNALPKLKASLVHAAVETGRMTKDEAEEHVRGHLDKVESMLRHDFEKFSEYTRMLDTGARGN